ncbi:hypothetical protein FHG87_006493 [Trinorchestia longiramus]|nr:hypothetical protein FHG87_006493 [Trinorchestia longiramus]
MLLTLLFLFVPEAHAIILQSTAVSVGKNFKIEVSTPLRSVMSSSPHACLGECLQDSLCLIVNYEGTTGTCELLPDSLKTSVEPGWTAFQQLEPITPQLMDPCASNPCPPEKVCIQYWPLAKLPHRIIPLYYGVTGYACSGHDWLLTMRNDSKTKCTFKLYEDKDFPQYDIESSAKLSTFLLTDRMYATTATTTGSSAPCKRIMTPAPDFIFATATSVSNRHGSLLNTTSYLNYIQSQQALDKTPVHQYSTSRRGQEQRRKERQPSTE